MVLLVTKGMTLITYSYKSYKIKELEEKISEVPLTSNAIYKFSGYRFKKPMYLFHLKIHLIETKSLLIAQTQLILVIYLFLFMTRFSFILSCNICHL